MVKSAVIQRSIIFWKMELLVLYFLKKDSLLLFCQGVSLTPKRSAYIPLPHAVTLD